VASLRNAETYESSELVVPKGGYTLFIKDGDVDRIVVARIGVETRLLIYQCEDQPLIQARLTDEERRQLAMLLSADEGKNT